MLLPRVRSLLYFLLPPSNSRVLLPVHMNRTRGSRNYYRSAAVHTADVLNQSLRLLHYVQRRTGAMTGPEQGVLSRITRLFHDVELELSDEVSFGAVEHRPVGLPALPVLPAAGGGAVRGGAATGKRRRID